MSARIETMTKLVTRSELDGDCWIWRGPKSRGYGLLTTEGKTWRVHRLGWTKLVGPIPDGLVLDHLCRRTLCWNPDHLRMVSQRTNVLAGNGWAARHSRKTHCPSGHQLPSVTGPGQARRCATCRREQRRRYEELHREELNRRARERYTASRIAS